MLPVLIDGDLWRVMRASPDSPFLVDRTGRLKVATTDVSNKVIRISSDLEPPLLDKVLVHEMAHAITVSHGLLNPLRAQLPHEHATFIEEWSADLVADHGIEAAMLASRSLGRPLCIGGYCIMSTTM